jgi:hypothetical protein
MTKVVKKSIIKIMTSLRAGVIFRTLDLSYCESAFEYPQKKRPEGKRQKWSGFLPNIGTSAQSAVQNLPILGKLASDS